MKYGLQQHERLKSRKRISQLFASGKHLKVYPLHVVWLTTDADSYAAPAQVAFSVSKRRFRSAVKRNRLKRLMREAYRLSKPELYESLKGHPSIALMLIYIGREELPLSRIREAFQQLMLRLEKDI